MRRLCLVAESQIRRLQALFTAVSHKLKLKVSGSASVKFVSYKQLSPRMQWQQHRPCGCCKAFLPIDASPGAGLCQARGECVA